MGRSDLAGPRKIRRAKLDHGSCARDYAEKINVYVLTDGAWQKVLDQVSGKPAPFDFRNHHPVYGNAVSQFLLPNLPAGGCGSELRRRARSMRGRSPRFACMPMSRIRKTAGAADGSGLHPKRRSAE